MEVIATYPCLGTPFMVELRHDEGGPYVLWITGGGHADRRVMTFSDEMPALIYGSGLQASAMYQRDEFMAVYDSEEA